MNDSLETVATVMTTPPPPRQGSKMSDNYYFLKDLSPFFHTSMVTEENLKVSNVWLGAKEFLFLYGQILARGSVLNVAPYPSMVLLLFLQTENQGEL